MNDSEIMKSTRLKLGLTQKEMAELCGYGSQSRISDIENGKENMSGMARQLLKCLRRESVDNRSVIYRDIREVENLLIKLEKADPEKLGADHALVMSTLYWVLKKGDDLAGMSKIPE